MKPKPKHRGAQIIRVFRLRRQSDAPVIQSGEIDGLRVLLSLGLTGSDALKLAPWCASDRHRDDVQRAPPQRVPNSMSNTIKLSFRSVASVPAWAASTPSPRGDAA
jgi:hypothetical protein